MWELINWLLGKTFGDTIKVNSAHQFSQFGLSQGHILSNTAAPSTQRMSGEYVNEVAITDRRWRRRRGSVLTESSLCWPTQQFSSCLPYFEYINKCAMTDWLTDGMREWRAGQPARQSASPRKQFNNNRKRPIRVAKLNWKLHISSSQMHRTSRNATVYLQF